MPMFARARGRAVVGHPVLPVLPVLSVLLPLLLAAGPAAAEPAARSTFVYGELLGKGGPWGIGVERALTPRLAVGGVVSAAVIRDQQLYTLAPYAHATIVRGRRHALFAELGAAIVHSRIPSPVEMWDGVSDVEGSDHWPIWADVSVE